MIQFLNKKFEPYIRAEEIRQRITELARQINTDYRDKELMFVSVLNGSFLFTADLFRQIDLHSYVQFIRVFSYHGTSTTGKVNEVMGLNESVKGRHVIIVEDIVDTGLTIDYIWKTVMAHEPASLKVASLLLKRDVYRGKPEIDYIGFEIPNAFVVGYGLDYEGLGRNLPEIYQLKE
jgi:hypoxanthine phosphoribosyltransferase